MDYCCVIIFLHYNNTLYVQIGSFDGVSNDEFGLKDLLLNETNATCVLIEPVKEYFDRLVINYVNAKSKCYFENIGIGDIDEKHTFFINGQDTSIVRVPTTKTEERNIDCKTFDYIVDKYNISKIDGLFIDVEGYELKILESIFSGNHPQINFIRYEFVHLSEMDNNKLSYILEYNNYSIFQDEKSYADRIAILKTNK